MTFNSNFQALNLVHETTTMQAYYTNEGLEVVPTMSEMPGVEKVASDLAAAGFSNVKIVGRKFKKILVNHISVETARATIISIEY